MSTGALDLTQRLMNAEERLKVQREYLDALSEREAYMRTWEHQKAQHKEQLEEMNERIGDLLDSMRSGIARPTQGELTLSSDDDLLARCDEALLEFDAEREKILLEGTTPGPEEAAPEAAEVAVPFPGEVLAGEQSSDASYWEAKKAEALGGIDAKVAARDYGFGKNWCATAAMQSAISEQLKVSMPVAAFHMGAHAKVAGMKVGRNPFVADGAEDQVNFDAWALGWGTVASLDLKVNTATLNMATEATTKKRGDIDDWPRVDGVRVSADGVIHPDDCTTLPRLKSKEGSGGGGIVRVKSKIEWTEATWNPLVGCWAVSPGCANCYAMRMAKRLAAMGQEKYQGVVNKHGKWTGEINYDEVALTLPLRVKKSTTWFVNSMSDLFHKDVPVAYIQRVFEVMRQCPQHTFQVLTKRAERLAEVSSELEWSSNVWQGVSVENGDYTGRIDCLRGTGARVKFLSLEPLLGPLPNLNLDGIHWVIVGGESGPGARPMDHRWVGDIRDQCLRAKAAFFFKQWGAWCPADAMEGDEDNPIIMALRDKQDREPMDAKPRFVSHEHGPFTPMFRVGKKAAGRMLDGRTWDELPAAFTAGVRV